MLTWCEKGSKLFTETCFLLKSRQSYTTGIESSALSKYWDDFCARRFGDINYSGLIFITWRCDYHGFNGISVYCVMFDRSPPRAGHWLFCSFDGQYHLFYSRSFKTILRWGSKEFLKMSRWILGWIFKVSRSTWKTFASCVSLWGGAPRFQEVSFHNVILHVTNGNNLCHRLVNTTLTRESFFSALAASESNLKALCPWRMFCN